MFLTQPFANYNFGEGWYLGTAPIITANWLTAGNNAWTLPVGAQVGRVVKIGGKLPVNFLVGAYYNALRPDFGPTGSCARRSRSSFSHTRGRCMELGVPHAKRDRSAPASPSRRPLRHQRRPRPPGRQGFRSVRMACADIHTSTGAGLPRSGGSRSGRRIPG